MPIPWPATCPSAGTGYDNELLDAHYIAGDGRANENIALTTVHTIFHDEHNRLVEQTKELVRGELANGDVSFALNWVLPGADLSDGIQDNEWNGDRLFQTAKFGTETQYQHLVFEEFARKIAPTIHLFGNTDIHLDPAIVSEFANAVYRFGHSMLDENVPMFQLNRGRHAGDRSADGPAGRHRRRPDRGVHQPARVRGQRRRHGGGDRAGHHASDRLGDRRVRHRRAAQQPAGPAARPRRAQHRARPRHGRCAAQPGAQRDLQPDPDTNLKPYENWDEFRQFLKHDASIINFLAAYGTHASIIGATTLEEKRAAALDLVLMGSSSIRPSQTSATPASPGRLSTSCTAWACMPTI